VAGLLGLPFAFAHHFSPGNTLPALALYRSAFRPSESLDRPHAMVAAAVVCADTDDRARWLAGPGALSFLRLRAGRPGTMPSPEEAAAHPYTELERAFVQDRQATQIIGAPETVRRGLADLLAATAADELMLTTMVFDPADRLRSFELVAALARTASAEGLGLLSLPGQARGLFGSRGTDLASITSSDVVCAGVVAFRVQSARTRIRLPDMEYR